MMTFAEHNINSLYKLFHKTLDHEPDKKDLLEIIKKIKSIDSSCLWLPLETCSMEDLIDWFGNNSKESEVMINYFMK